MEDLPLTLLCQRDFSDVALPCPFPVLPCLSPLLPTTCVITKQGPDFYSSCVTHRHPLSEGSAVFPGALNSLTHSWYSKGDRERTLGGWEGNRTVQAGSKQSGQGEKGYVRESYSRRGKGTRRSLWPFSCGTCSPGQTSLGIFRSSSQGSSPRSRWEITSGLWGGGSAPGGDSRV